MDGGQTSKERFEKKKVKKARKTGRGKLQDLKRKQVRTVCFFLHHRHKINPEFHHNIFIYRNICPKNILAKI